MEATHEVKYETLSTSTQRTKTISIVIPGPAPQEEVVSQ